MFDLDGAVAAWRERMLAGGAVTSSAADEMEDHLRSSAADLARPGLSAEEAFLVAARRLGGPSELEAEHLKVAAPGRRPEARWLLAGILIAAIVPSAARIVGLAVTFLVVGAGVTNGVVMYAGTVVALVTAAFLLFRLHRSASRGTGALSRLVGRPALGAVAVALGVLLAVRAAEVAASFGVATSMPRAPTTDSFRMLAIVGGLSTVVLPIAALVVLAWPIRAGERHAA